jgi:sideroflexin-5
MIDISKPRYDQSTYWGRLKHFSELTDPTNLLVTSEQLEQAKRMIDFYKANKLEHVDEEILWKAKKLVDSTFHPDTGEKIFLPFRMASYYFIHIVLFQPMFPLLPLCSFLIRQRQ